MSSLRRPTLLVTGAGGRVGGAALRALVARGRAPIALVRDPRRAGSLAERVEHRCCDLDDRAGLEDAFAGIDALLLCSGHGPDLLGHQLNTIAAAQDAGVRRIVKISASPASVFEGSPNRAAANHREVEAVLAHAGVEYTCIRPNAFIQGVASSRAAIADGELPLTLGDQALSWVDTEDVGEVAAGALLAGGPLPEVIPVTGPQALTGVGLAEILTAVTGRHVLYRALTDAEQQNRLRAAGAPAWLAEHVVSIFALLRERDGDRVTDAVEHWTGRPATPAADALTRDADKLGLELATSMQEEIRT